MRRRAFKMKLRAGYEQEYKKRHDEIWPDLKRELTKAGLGDYSIFLDKETLTLFGVQRISNDAKADELRRHPIMQKWWDYMADIMEANPDNSPVEVELEEVFHLD